jgi:hypothetical protein
MKPRSTLHHFAILALAATQIFASLPLSAAPSPAPGKNQPQPKTPPAAVEPEIPQSLFTIPTSSKEGKDPFFPASARPYTSGTPARTNAPVKPGPAVDFVLNGISGSADKPLAMINGRTFGNNEEGDIPSSSGRVHIRCVEIKADSAIIEFRGERRELKLRKGL